MPRRGENLVRNITMEELKASLDRGDDIKLVMTMNEWQFQAEHIPGSIWVADKERAERLLDPNDKIVTYCSEPACSASRMAAHLMEKAGYKHVWHYEGGLQEWTAAGVSGGRYPRRLRLGRPAGARLPAHKEGRRFRPSEDLRGETAPSRTFIEA